MTPDRSEALACNRLRSFSHGDKVLRPSGTGLPFGLIKPFAMLVRRSSVSCAAVENCSAIFLLDFLGDKGEGRLLCFFFTLLDDLRIVSLGWPLGQIAGFTPNADCDSRCSVALCCKSACGSPRNLQRSHTMLSEARSASELALSKGGHDAAELLTCLRLGSCCGRRMPLPKQ